MPAGNRPPSGWPGRALCQMPSAFSWCAPRSSRGSAARRRPIIPARSPDPLRVEPPSALGRPHDDQSTSQSFAPTPSPVRQRSHNLTEPTDVPPIPISGFDVPQMLPGRLFGLSPMITLKTVCPCQSPEMSGVPNGIRTRAAALKGRSPRPLDDGDVD
jgi:hypothetical protein